MLRTPSNQPDDSFTFQDKWSITNACGLRLFDLIIQGGRCSAQRSISIQTLLFATLKPCNRRGLGKSVAGFLFFFGSSQSFTHLKPPVHFTFP